MIIGIAGLGLIGGSLAKAYKLHEGITVLGFDTDESALAFAGISGAIDGVLDSGSIASCDAVLIAVTPKAAVEYLARMAPHIDKSTLVIDCCGVKRAVCENCFAIAKQHGFTFVGGHPMAGTQYSGFKHSRANLFKGAPMILVPPVYDDIILYTRIEDILKPAGFGRFTFTTAEKHDEMIAFSSQMAHLLSNAFIKSPTAKSHKGFSAGSYKDLTRVARLNADMWTELFLENRDILIKEIDVFTDSIRSYRNALQNNDAETLHRLLEEGSAIKEEVDGR